MYGNTESNAMMHIQNISILLVRIRFQKIGQDRLNVNIKCNCIKCESKSKTVNMKIKSENFCQINVNFSALLLIYQYLARRIA